MERIRSGDPEAFRALLEETWTPLVRYVEGRAGSLDTAQDIAQEAFVRLWERRERWSGGSPRAVLFRIARNEALDRERKRDVRHRLSDEVAARSARRPPSPAEELEADELRRAIVLAVGDLPERRREVFELVRYRGLTYAEVAEVTGLSSQTVANHVSLALQDLRTRLAHFAAGGTSTTTTEESDHG